MMLKILNSYKKIYTPLQVNFKQLQEHLLSTLQKIAILEFNVFEKKREFQMGCCKFAFQCRNF